MVVETVSRIELGTKKNKMKTIVHTILIGIMLFGSGVTFSQEEGDKPLTKKEKRAAIKVAIITEKLDLTEAESKAFWPVYDEFTEDRKALRKNFKKTKDKSKKMEDLTDEEVETIITESFDYKQKELDLKKKYHLKLKEILPIKKIAKLYHIEKRINQEVRARSSANRSRPGPRNRRR